jgi:hypothetical protein
MRGIIKSKCLVEKIALTPVLSRGEREFSTTC